MGGVVSLYVVKPSIKANSEKLNIGDGFIPSLAQLGLGYDSTQNSRILEPLTTNPAHIDAANDILNWTHIFQNIRKESLVEFELPVLSGMQNGLAGIAPVGPDDYIQVGPTVLETGGLFFDVITPSGDLAPSGTKLVIENIEGTHEATFTISKPGSIEFTDLVPGDYIVKTVILPG